MIPIATILGDARYALRFLGRSPGYTAVALACLVLGIGVNSSAFGIINAVALRPPAGVAEPERLRSVYQSHAGEFGPVTQDLSLPEYRVYAAAAAGVAELAGYTRIPVSLGWGGEVEAAGAELVSPSYFAVVGAAPAVGRAIAAEDERQPVAVVSHAYWLRRLGGRRDVVGSTLRIGGQPFSVVGVAPEGFAGLNPAGGEGSAGPAVWVPVGTLPLLRPAGGAAGPDDPAALPFRTVARLAEGVTDGAAAARFEVAAREVERRFPRVRREAGARLTELGYGPGDTRASVWGAIAALMAAPVLILVIACANLANLQLARGSQRTREIAVRLALGASRGRIVHQLLTEALVLAVAGGAGALLLARWLAPLARHAGIDTAGRTLVDGRLLAFTAGVSAATAVLFGLVPAARAARADPMAGLRDGAGSGGRSRARSALVMTQVALSTALLVACVLLVMGARRAATLDLGIQRAGLVLAPVDFAALGYDAAKAEAVERRILDALAATPGVAAAASSDFRPLESVGEEKVSTGSDERWVKAAFVRGDFVHAAGMRVRDGAAPRAGEGVVVTEALARRLWPGRRAVGQVLTIGEGAARRAETVAAVAAGVRLRAGGETEPLVLVPRDGPAAQAGTSWFYVRTRGAQAALIPAVRRAIQDADPAIPFPQVRTADAWVARSLRPEWTTALAVGGFGCVALLLAAAGVFAVTSFLVARRTREMGIRISLGATRGAILGLVLGEALRLAAGGVAAGLVMSIGIGAAMRGLLNGMEPFSPAAFAGVAAALAATALVAAVVPALRASRVEPMAALRVE